VAKRFEVWIVRFDPVEGSEMAKTRPAVIVSPDEANDALRTVIVAPLTSTRKKWPTRVEVRFRRKPGEVALDHMRSIDKQRLEKKAGSLTADEAKAVAERLVEMFRR
jgi:mRNA interferase MazF